MSGVGLQLLALQKTIVKAKSCFTSSQWKELGVITDCSDLVNNHPRLLRSLSFGDDDYEGCILDVLQGMIERNPKNIHNVQAYIDARDQGDELNISSSTGEERKIVFSPNTFVVPSENTLDPSLVAVMMPFSLEFNPVLDAIKTGVENCGLLCNRADDLWEASVIVQDVFSLIYRANIVVCDFSGRNPNVFYETGIAHTLGKHVVPITQSLNDVPSDLRHHRVLLYLNNEQGLLDMRGKLSERLRKLREGPSKNALC